jgi:fucose permease
MDRSSVLACYAEQATSLQYQERRRAEHMGLGLLREVIMNFFGDKRFLYAIAVLVVVIVVAAVFWPRNETVESQAPATTSSPTATPASPSPTAPKQ